MGVDEAKSKYFKDNEHYYSFDTLFFILKALISQTKKDGLRIMGVDAKSGYGKSYMAQCLDSVLSREEIVDFSGLDQFTKELNDKLSVYIPLNHFDYSYEFTHILYIIFLHLYEKVKKVENTGLTYDSKDLIEACKTGVAILLSKTIKSVSGMDFYELSEDIKNQFKEIEMDNEISNDYGALKEIREKISNILKELGNVQIIFIVDNLDKCNPKFITRFLEIFEHVFRNHNIILLLMMDYEYIQDVGRGAYGNNLNLHYFYDIHFHKIHKMYIKDKREFIVDLISNRLEHIKALCEKDESLINDIYEVVSLYDSSLYDIEQSLFKLDYFLDYNSFFEYYYDKLIESFFEIKDLLIFMYSFILLQIINLSLFNALLYSDEALNKDETDKTLIYSTNEQMNVLFQENKSIIEMVKYYYIKDYVYSYPSSIEFKMGDKTELVKVKINGNDISDDDILERECSLGMFYGYKDIKEYDTREGGIEKLLKMSFKNYLRFKISQL